MWDGPAREHRLLNSSLQGTFEWAPPSRTTMGLSELWTNGFRRVPTRRYCPGNCFCLWGRPLGPPLRPSRPLGQRFSPQSRKRTAPGPAVLLRYRYLSPPNERLSRPVIPDSAVGGLVGADRVRHSVGPNQRQLGGWKCGAFFPTSLATVVVGHRGASTGRLGDSPETCFSIRRPDRMRKSSGRNSTREGTD